MTQEEVQKLSHGVYWLYFSGDGRCLASVGSLHDGRRWYACSNWTSKDRSGVVSTDWELVEWVELIMARAREDWDRDELRLPPFSHLKSMQGEPGNDPIKNFATAVLQGDP